MPIGANKLLYNVLPTSVILVVTSSNPLIILSLISLINFSPIILPLIPPKTPPIIAPAPVPIPGIIEPTVPPAIDPALAPT